MTLPRHINVRAFKQAWQRVLDRHTILRTAFEWEGLEEPLQIVYRATGLQWEELDWRGVPESDQQSNLQDRLLDEARRGFDLRQPPLMRLIGVRLNEAVYHLVWACHHLLVDGWSVPLVLEEVLALAASFHYGRELSLEPVRPFRDYIEWLQRQDLSEAEVFWRDFLRGFAAPMLLVTSSSKGPESSSRDQGEREIRISQESTTRLQQSVRQHDLTLNTVVLGAWALVVARYVSADDVVFGTTVSGRPPELPGVEGM